MPDRRLTEIWIYPIKSLGGVRLKSSRVKQKGLEWDRRWMLTDLDGIFQTQRLLPRMSLFKVALADRGIRVMFGGDEMVVPFESSGSSRQAVVWNDIVEVLEVDKTYSDWFSERLGQGCRLVSFPEDRARLVDPEYRLSDEHVSLADAYPLLIIGEQSLADLNNRLAEPIPMNRFRPNLVFSGSEPYEEDRWREFRVGQNRFAGVKNCSRCVVTTVDQATGTKGMEPLVTLATYRKREGGVYFGQNVIPIDNGQVSEGDEIIVG